jgi:hypothetical protein
LRFLCLEKVILRRPRLRVPLTEDDIVLIEIFRGDDSNWPVERSETTRESDIEPVVSNRLAIRLAEILTSEAHSKAPSKDLANLAFLNGFLSDGAFGGAATGRIPFATDLIIGRFNFFFLS